MTSDRSAASLASIDTGGHACAECGNRFPPSLLACPSCGRLLHADALKDLAGKAENAERQGDPAGALTAWRQVLELLPPTAMQAERVRGRVQVLSAEVPSAMSWSPPSSTTPGSRDGGARAAGAGGATGAGAHPARRRSGIGKWLAGLGTVGILLAKFKWALLLLLGKGKLLVTGLLQAKTFLSMAVALGVYATIYGWRFALGLIVSIYIHEMGHVFWLRRYGIPATAPMFIPGVGAFVRLKQHPATVVEDARVGLAGPVWGAAAAVASLVLGVMLELPILLAIARVGAWINLFNLIPIWQLDGGRGFKALSRQQRGVCAAVLWVLALFAKDGMLFLLAIAATFRAVSKGGEPPSGNRGVLATYLALIIGLTLLMALAVRVATGLSP